MKTLKHIDLINLIKSILNEQKESCNIKSLLPEDLTLLRIEEASVCLARKIIEEYRSE